MSEPNQGSEFEFSFINKISEKEPQIQDNGFGYVKSIKQNQISPQVFIIDEDKSSLTLLSTQLKNVGFKVHSTSDIRNAIQEFNLQKPDFVFLGIKAPFDNAFKFIKNIREDQFNNKIPIYLISATIFDEELSIKIKESKTNGILLKPYDIEKIFLILKENLNIEYEYFNNNPNLKRIEKQHKISKELIDKLPKLWKQNIIENIQQGDIEKIRELIDMLDNKLSELKEIFISYIDEYNYQGLLDLLEGRY
jgi:CheY-like chemotaxis protein